MPRKRRQAFIWPKRKQTSKYQIKIDGTDRRKLVISAEFTKAVNPDIGSFAIMLDNNNGQFTNLYTGGEEVELDFDFSAGTTRRFLGKINGIENVLGNNGYVVILKGSHISDDVLDITVTASYSGNTTTDAILKELIDNNLTGFTYTNVEAFTNQPVINWQNKQFWSAVKDLLSIDNADCYVDDDKDFHYFERGSKESTTEAVVWKDTLISITGLGTSSTDVKNKIRVFGQDDTGLPILYTASNTTSQSSFGVKERIINDTTYNSEDIVQKIGDGNLILEKDPKNKGKVISRILPSLVAGEKVWITSPLQQILGQFRVKKVTHRLPSEQTICVIERERNISDIFRERIEKELSLQTLNNPNNMEFSYNFTFDDTTNIDTDSSTANIQLSEGKLSISTGAEGTMISKPKTTTSNVTQIHLKVIGEATPGTTYYVRADSSVVWQTITPEALTDVTTPGKLLQLKIDFTSTSTLIDSIALLYK